MDLSEFDLGDVGAVALAATLLRTFGHTAHSLAVAQAETDVKRPDIAARWKQAAKAIEALTQANTHMEIALELLNSVEERHVAARLQHAIDTLGVQTTLPVDEI